MKVGEVIEKLQKLDKSLPVYLDCSHCGKALEWGELKEVVVVKSAEKRA